MILTETRIMLDMVLIITQERNIFDVLRNEISKYGIDKRFVFEIFNGKMLFSHVNKDIVPITKENTPQAAQYIDGIMLSYNFETDLLKLETEFTQTLTDWTMHHERTDVIHRQIIPAMQIFEQYLEFCDKLQNYSLMINSYEKGNKTIKYFWGLSSSVSKFIYKIIQYYPEAITKDHPNCTEVAMSIISRHPNLPFVKSTPDVQSTAIPFLAKDEQPAQISPKIFISYSYDNEQHERWVENFAVKLKQNGINVLFDKWEKLGKQLPNFMEQAIDKAERVICVMTPNYKIKTDNLNGGVGFEYSIINAEIFKKVDTTKFIPMFRNGNDEDAIPVSLKGRKYLDMRNDSDFEKKFQELLEDVKNK
jgi:hypothetical protein